MLTHFPHGVSSFGVPVLSGAFGMDDSATIYFVDKKTGSDSQTGKEPSRAFKTIEKALAVSGAYDVVYVMDPGTTSSDPNTYSGASANYTIPVASKGLALIGAASGGLIRNGRSMAPSIYAYAAATAIIKVNAPQVTIENFRICGAYDQSGSEVAGIYVQDFSEGVYEGFGLSVDNCYFEDINSVGNKGSIAIEGQWNATITNCTFMNCETGISVVSSGSTCVGTVIDTVKFLSRDGAGTKINYDIYIYCQGESGILINNFMIGHDSPAARPCIVAVAGTEDGLISNGCFLDANGTMHATTGTAIRVPATIGLSNIHDGDNALTAAN